MNKTNQLQPLIEADVAQFNTNTQSTHQPTTENSVLRVVKILHARYFPLLSADDLLRDVDAKIDAWIVEVIAAGILEANIPNTQTFTTNLKALAKDQNDQWDCVHTEAGPEFCRMWVAIPCVMAALKDHDRFISPGVTPEQREKLYKERLISDYLSIEFNQSCYKIFTDIRKYESKIVKNFFRKSLSDILLHNFCNVASH